MNKTKQRVSRVAALVLLSLGGCGLRTPAQCNRTEVIALRLSPAARLNQDREGNARSVVLRLYQLDNSDTFKRSSFEQLWSDPTAGAGTSPSTLGADELIVVPGRAEAHLISRSPKASRLAIAANFREHQAGSGWRAVVPLPAPKDPCGRRAAKHVATVNVKLLDYALSLR